MGRGPIVGPSKGGGMMNKGRFEVRRRRGRIVIFNFAVMIAHSVISSMPLSSFGLKVCQSPNFLGIVTLTN